MLHLVVGLTAILVSVFAVLLAARFTRAANRALADTRRTLERVEERTEDVKRDVSARMVDLIQRAVPLQREQAEASALQQLLVAAMQDPKAFENLLHKNEVVNEEATVPLQSDL